MIYLLGSERVNPFPNNKILDSPKLSLQTKILSVMKMLESFHEG